MNFVAKINRLIDENVFNYYGIMAATLIAGSCIASGAVIAILTNDAPVWQLFMICAVAMGSNAASISHSPLRWVVWAFLVNVVLSIILIGINLT